MPLTIPNIDDRDYRQILNEGLARIPVHNPEWTNFNDSDPGVTLIQVFAFMTENLLYRSNLIPERNRVKFLKLLGIPVQPATAAHGIVLFNNIKGEVKTQTLPVDLEVSAGQVPFRTLDGIDALPVEGRVYYKKTVSSQQVSQDSGDLYLKLYSAFFEENPSLQPKFYETRQLEPPTSGATFPYIDLSDQDEVLDGSLWVALLAPSKTTIEEARQAIASKILTLGIMPYLKAESVEVLPAGPVSSEQQPELIFHIPIGETYTPNVQHGKPRYRLLNSTSSGNVLSEPGVVNITLPRVDDIALWENLEPMEAGTGDFPPSLEESEVKDRLVTWIRIRVRGSNSTSDETDTANKLTAPLSWVGVNAARVKQLAHVSAENPGTGTGEPDQIVTLTNTPVIPESVEITIDGEAWQRIDDLYNAGPEVPVRSPRQIPTIPPSSTRIADSKVFVVNRESGEITFGDGLRGARPPVGSVIRVSYDYGGGLQGNVGIGAINKSPGVENGIKVNNEIPCWGGDETETTQEAEKHIAAFLKHRDRLVSAQDFETIASRTPGVELGRVEVLPLFNPDTNLQDVLAEGVVTLMVIPSYDPLYPDTPEPDRLFLQTVCDYLSPRRLITTELHVAGPQYVPIWISVGIDVIPGVSVPPVREAVKTAIKEFLSPFTGGFTQDGWPLKKSVEALELWAVATRVEGVSKVNGVLIALEVNGTLDRIPMKGLQLPRILGISVETGDPKTIDQVRSDFGVDQAGTTTPTVEIFPVPVALPECK